MGPTEGHIWRISGATKIYQMEALEVAQIVAVYRCSLVALDISHAEELISSFPTSHGERSFLNTRELFFTHDR